MLRYTVKRSMAECDIESYVKDYIDIESFEQCCSQCHNYGNCWSCPPYDFKCIDYWFKYNSIQVFAYDMVFDIQDLQEINSLKNQEYVEAVAKEVVAEAKKVLSRELMALEKANPGSISLSAGNCSECGEDGCARIKGEECISPDKMRYSMESLGANVGLTISKLMNIEIDWIEEGKLPKHMVLVSALLLP